MTKLVISVASNGWIVRENLNEPKVFTDWQVFIDYQRSVYERVSKPKTEADKVHVRIKQVPK